MPKSKKGKNAFYFYMLEWKKLAEKKGRTFPNGLQDVNRDPQLSEDWKNLPKQQKGYYEAMAKDSKVKSQASYTKRTALGENISEVLANEKREQEFQQNMLQYIDSVVSMGSQHNNLEKIKFLFIHVNWFYRREIGINKYDFCPAEFAVAEFSLGNGTQNIYHEIINVKIPLGWKRDAYETSMETHKICIELEEGEDNFALMYDKLVAILNANRTGNKFPPLFTMKAYVLPVQSLLEKMANAADKTADDFVIYSLEALFGALRNAATLHVDNCSIPLVIAEYEFGKDIFSSVQNLECDYHKNIDGTSLYCSKAIVKRWGFTICDYCCEYLKIPMIEGVHCPVPPSNLFTKKNTLQKVDVAMRNLSISKKQYSISARGVSEEYRERMSAQTDEEIQRRRNECKPLEIIDHGKLRTTSQSILPERPLRSPRTMAQVLANMQEKNVKIKENKE